MPFYLGITLEKVAMCFRLNVTHDINEILSLSFSKAFNFLSIENNESKYKGWFTPDGILYLSVFHTENGFPYTLHEKFCLEIGF